MSGLGKTNTGFSRKNYAESRSIARGYKSLKFAHQAVLGATGIDLSALTAPTYMTANGFVQPSGADLSAARLLTNRAALRIKSSIRGELEEYVDFLVTGDTSIRLIDPYVAADGETFIGVIQDSTRTGLGIMDAIQAASSGTLVEGSTDFAIWGPVPVTPIAGSQVPSILVMRSGVPMVQNVGNSSTGEGNFYLVDNGTGFSNLIRFNEAGNMGGEPIIVVPIGVLPFMGTDTMNSALQSHGAQLDAIVAALVEGFGLAPTELQANPNFPDLRQFGDLVVDARNRIVLLESQAAIAAILQMSVNKTVSTTQPADFDTKIYDPLGMVTTGANWKCTIPKTGLWRITGQAVMGVASREFRIYRNGSYYYMAGVFDAGLTRTNSVEVLLVKDDYIDIRSNASDTWGGGLQPGSGCTLSISLVR